MMVTLHYNYIHICNGMPDGMFYKFIIFILHIHLKGSLKKTFVSCLKIKKIDK